MDGLRCNLTRAFKNTQYNHIATFFILTRNIKMCDKSIYIEKGNDIKIDIQ